MLCLEALWAALSPSAYILETLLACTYCITVPHTDRIPCHVTGPYFRILGAKDSQILCQTFGIPGRKLNGHVSMRTGYAYVLSFVRSLVLV